MSKGWLSFISATLHLWYCFRMQLDFGMFRQQWECQADFYMAIGIGKVKSNAIFYFSDYWWHKSIKTAKFQKSNIHHTFQTMYIMFPAAPVRLTVSLSNENISFIYNTILVKFRDILCKICISLPCEFHELPRKDTRLIKVVRVFLGQPSHKPKVVPSPRNKAPNKDPQTFLDKENIRKKWNSIFIFTFVYNRSTNYFWPFNVKFAN